MSGPAGPQAYRRAQQLAAQADNALSAGDIAAAGALAAMAQVHATQAATAATMAQLLGVTLTAGEAWRAALGMNRPGQRPVVEGTTE